jgi:hypothetical protein
MSGRELGEKLGCLTEGKLEELWWGKARAWRKQLVMMKEPVLAISLLFQALLTSELE